MSVLTLLAKAKAPILIEMACSIKPGERGKMGFAYVRNRKTDSSTSWSSPGYLLVLALKAKRSKDDGCRSRIDGQTLTIWRNCKAEKTIDGTYLCNGTIEDHSHVTT